MAKYRTYHDFLPQLQKEYPWLKRGDIIKILRFGFSNLDKLMRGNMDFFTSDQNGFLAYFGDIIANRYRLLRYYKEKLQKRIRYLYIKRRVIWDGYYYFGITENQYMNILRQNPKLLKSKTITFKKIKLYQIFDECRMANRNHQHFFRIPYTVNMGFQFSLEYLNTKNAEVIFHRRIMTFDELLVNRTEYDLLNGNYAKYF